MLYYVCRPEICLRPQIHEVGSYTLFLQVVVVSRENIVLLICPNIQLMVQQLFLISYLSP